MRVHLAFALPVLLSACDQPGPPGARIGEFRISARLDTNGCGPSAVQASTGVEFDVDLRKDGETGYWIQDGNAPVAGALDEGGAFLFEIRGQIAVRDEDPSQALAACAIDRVDEVRGVVTGGGSDAGTPAALDGEETLSFATAAGADCSDQLGLGTGQFIALPCQVRYEMEGTEIPSPE